MQKDNVWQNDVELLAPAGDFETALAAFEAGADAVYCGLSDFSARAFAKNFSLEDLKNLVRFAHAPQPPARARPRRVYVTFNTLVDEDDLPGAVERLARLDEIGPDALIVQDIGVASLCRRHFPRLELHASTQLVAHNLEGVLALKDLGFRRVVLARELSLEEISSIARRSGDMELEVFVHGALCYSVSGLCLFGAMEKGRSGNRGKCPYCCREGRAVVNAGGERNGALSYPFSMKDLRLGEDVRKLADAGVASLKIEGRMKSALYVASVTRYYRQILGEREQGTGDRGQVRSRVTVSDLETVFSRRTTELYFNSRPDDSGDSISPVDSESLGHLGAEIGTVKRITKDREGLGWLRFHTSRGLEKHDGLQFAAMVDGKHVGMGVVEMRQAISRRPVFEVNAGVDVEVLLPGVSPNTEARRPRDDSGETDLSQILKPGMKIYCSMSNAVKRMFPTPSFRPSDYAGGTEIDVTVTLEETGISASAEAVRTPILRSEATIDCELSAAKNPEKTLEGVKKAFSKLGETDYRLGKLTLNDPERLFAPMSVLNDLRRDLVERLDEARDKVRREKIEKAVEDEERGSGFPAACQNSLTTVKLRADQKVPAGDWDEVVVAVNSETTVAEVSALALRPLAFNLRLALPVYTAEPDFNRLRSAVKRFLREGYDRWEASDLATLRMLKALGVDDVTGDWTLYAFNSRALDELAGLGVRRFVASPENGRDNLQYLAESGHAVEFLVQQSTPLFVSLTKPAAEVTELSVFRRDGLWVTTRPVPRTFGVPDGVSTRLDLSWDPVESQLR